MREGLILTTGTRRGRIISLPVHHPIVPVVLYNGSYVCRGMMWVACASRVYHQIYVAIANNATCNMCFIIIAKLCHPLHLCNFTQTLKYLITVQIYNGVHDGYICYAHYESHIIVEHITHKHTHGVSLHGFHTEPLWEWSTTLAQSFCGRSRVHKFNQKTKIRMTEMGWPWGHDVFGVPLLAFLFKS